MNLVDLKTLFYYRDLIGFLSLQRDSVPSFFYILFPFLINKSLVFFFLVHYKKVWLYQQKKNIMVVGYIFAL